MNNEDRRYLKSVEKMRPSHETFERMVRILKKVREETNQILNTIENTLLENSKTIRI